MEALSHFSTATLHDAAARLGIRCAIDGIASLRAGARLSGPALTLKYAPKHPHAKTTTLYDVISAAPVGSVIVVELGLDRWVAGGNITAFAQKHGLGGMLIDGCIRDVAEIAESGFPIFSRGPAVSSYSVDMMLTEVGGRVICRGLQVENGDFIVADDDGACAIPAARAAEVLHQAEDIQRIDLDHAEGIRSGWPLERIHESIARWRRLRP